MIPTDRDVLLKEKCTYSTLFNNMYKLNKNKKICLNSILVYKLLVLKYEWISFFDLSGFSGLPLNGFTYYWTLSSKCFSTFPHGTCSLSVSWLYLALDGVYHPLRAALSSNPTLRRDSPKIDSGHYGPGTLYGLWPRSRRTWTHRTILG